MLNICKTNKTVIIELNESILIDNKSNILNYI